MPFFTVAITMWKTNDTAVEDALRCQSMNQQVDIVTPISTEVDDYGRRYDGVVIKSILIKILKLYYDVHQTRRLSEHFDRTITRSTLKEKKKRHKVWPHEENDSKHKCKMGILHT